MWNLAANLVQPVFEGGRRRAEVRRTDAVKLERLNAYGAAVLTALREVEDALTQERQQRLFIDNLRVQVALARETLGQARQRYTNGLSDYLPVLTALQAQQNRDRDLLTARRQLISYRIQLYRALGGSWARELTFPVDNGDAE